ncbi:uncharacterized [Tachysurus ichikawai]
MCIMKRMKMSVTERTSVKRMRRWMIKRMSVIKCDEEFESEENECDEDKCDDACNEDVDDKEDKDECDEDT